MAACCKLPAAVALGLFLVLQVEQKLCRLTAKLCVACKDLEKPSLEIRKKIKHLAEVHQMSMAPDMLDCNYLKMT